MGEDAIAKEDKRPSANNAAIWKGGGSLDEEGAGQGGAGGNGGSDIAGLVCLGTGGGAGAGDEDWEIEGADEEFGLLLFIAAGLGIGNGQAGEDRRRSC